MSLILIFVGLLLYFIGKFIYDFGYSNGREKGLIDGVNYTKKDLSNVFIVDGICKNNGRYICNLGYACDACPYYRDNNK